MKKLLVTIATICMAINVFADIFDDTYIPKINHGTLVKLDVNTLSNTLGLSLDEICAGPNFTADKYYMMNLSYMEDCKMNPQLFYEQKIDALTEQIYRVEFSPSKATDNFRKTYNKYFSFEKIYIKKKNEKIAHLCFEGYKKFYWFEEPSNSNSTEYDSNMLIIRNNSLAGIMLYDKRGASVYFFDNNFYIAGRKIGDIPDIEIEASWPLIDKNDQFKYTIQNAFDQNPATSFVEDTDDDLMEIDCYPSDNYIPETKLLVTEVKLINGYAANKSLYNSNNRIKSIKSILSQKNAKGIIYTINNLRFEYKGESDINFIPKKSQYGLGLTHILNIPFNDNTLDYQHLYISNYLVGKIFPIAVSSIYSGSKYNDTCIAELDIKYSDTWLFGGYDD